MPAASLSRFLDFALRDPSKSWEHEGLRSIGELQVPHNCFGQYPWLFRGDIHRLWAEWFLGACVDVNSLAISQATYPQIYAKVQKYCVAEIGESHSTLDLAKSFARIVAEHVHIHSPDARRKRYSLEERQALIDLSDGEPRCWVCGYKFTEPSIDNFLGAKHSLQLPQLIDVFKPHGLIERDLQIEIDHVFPFSRGGSDADNLRLACGWCNKYKSDHISLYDAPGIDMRVQTQNGVLSLPQPLWVIRLLALAQRSEISGHTPRSTELTVTLRWREGKATPTNLKVVAYEDGVCNDQMISYNTAFSIWKRSRNQF